MPFLHLIALLAALLLALELGGEELPFPIQETGGREGVAEEHGEE